MVCPSRVPSRGQGMELLFLKKEKLRNEENGELVLG